MIRLFKDMYLTNRFFASFGVIVALFALTQGWPYFFPVVQGVLGIFLVGVVADIILLFNPNFVISVKRNLPKVFSLGDANEVRLDLISSFNIP